MVVLGDNEGTDTAVEKQLGTQPEASEATSDAQESVSVSSIQEPAPEVVEDHTFTVEALNDKEDVVQDPSPVEEAPVETAKCTEPVITQTAPVAVTQCKKGKKKKNKKNRTKNTKAVQSVTETEKKEEDSAGQKTTPAAVECVLEAQHSTAGDPVDTICTVTLSLVEKEESPVDNDNEEACIEVTVDEPTPVANVAPAEEPLEDIALTTDNVVCDTDIATDIVDDGSLVEEETESECMDDTVIEESDPISMEEPHDVPDIVADSAPEPVEETPASMPNNACPPRDTHYEHACKSKKARRKNRNKAKAKANGTTAVSAEEESIKMSLFAFTTASATCPEEATEAAEAAPPATRRWKLKVKPSMSSTEEFPAMPGCSDATIPETEDCKESYLTVLNRLVCTKSLSKDRMVTLEASKKSRNQSKSSGSGAQAQSNQDTHADKDSMAESDCRFDDDDRDTDYWTCQKLYNQSSSRRSRISRRYR